VNLLKVAKTDTTNDNVAQTTWGDSVLLEPTMPIALWSEETLSVVDKLPILTPPTPDVLTNQILI
jgi:hypothetical protein